ncbi:MAG: response regulator [Pseudomonadota bacterium]|nr:response regulator [Pseudomonadota bacterium]
MVVLDRVIKVLLVDDEPAILSNLEAYFEDEGFEILKAESGEEAVAILVKEPVDVVIVDMRLPGIDGNEMMRQALADGVKSKFIIHTGSNEYRVPDDLATLGVSMDNVFLKPIKDMAILARAVRVLVGS